MGATPYRRPQEKMERKEKRTNRIYRCKLRTTPKYAFQIIPEQAACMIDTAAG